MLKKFLAGALALALSVVPELVGSPTPPTVWIGRAPAAGQPATVCLDPTISTCTPIGSMPRDAFIPNLPPKRVPPATLPHAPLPLAGGLVTGPLVSQVSGGGPGAAFFAQSADPYLALQATGGAVDGKLWNFGATSNSLSICAVNDAQTTSACALNMYRGGMISVGGLVGWPSGAVIPDNTLSNITMPFLQVTGDSPVPINFSGTTQYNGISSSFTSHYENAAETAGYFSIVSTKGINSINYKAAVVGISQVLPGGGAGIGGNLVCSLYPNLTNTSQARCNALEADVNNKDADRTGSAWSPSGYNYSIGIIVSGAGRYQSNTGVEITSGNNGSPNKNPMWEVGLRFSQPNTSFASIAAASIQDEGGAGTSFNDLGRHTIGIGLNGIYKTGGAALNLAGVYQGTARPLVFPNGSISARGAVTAVSYRETLTTPASSSAACTPGQFTDDANYHYVCVATNRWKRAALSAF